MKKMLILTGVLFVAMMALLEVASACPNCKEAYIEGGGTVSSGYNTSILFMMITPFVVLGLIGLRIVFAAKKKRREDAQLHLN